MSERALGLITALVLFAAAGPHAELSDPTRPPQTRRSSAARPEVASNGDPRSIEVREILISPERRIAVINGQRRTIGDQIAGARVLEIQPHAVVFSAASGEFEVRVSPHVVKAVVPAAEEEQE